jgi:hypothetical protein
MRPRLWHLQRWNDSQAALIELLGRVGARLGESVTVSTEELNQWPAAAVAALKSQGLLLKARPAKSVVCPAANRNAACPCTR